MYDWKRLDSARPSFVTCQPVVRERDEYLHTYVLTFKEDESRPFELSLRRVTYVGRRLPWTQDASASSTISIAQVKTANTP